MPSRCARRICSTRRARRHLCGAPRRSRALKTQSGGCDARAVLGGNAVTARPCRPRIRVAARVRATDDALRCETHSGAHSRDDTRFFAANTCWRASPLPMSHQPPRWSWSTRASGARCRATCARASAQRLGTRVQLAGRRARDASRDQSRRVMGRLVREWHHVTNATTVDSMTTFTEVIEGSHATHVARFGVVAQQ